MRRTGCASGGPRQASLTLTPASRPLVPSRVLGLPRVAAQDSYFISSDGLSAGVADGVGEWGARFGLNPRDFATELMDGAQQAAEDLQRPGAFAASVRCSRRSLSGIVCVVAAGTSGGSAPGACCRTIHLRCTPSPRTQR